MRLHAIVVVVSILGAGASVRAAELGEHKDFDGVHLFRVLDAKPGDLHPRLALVASVPGDRFLGQTMAGGRLVVHLRGDDGTPISLEGDASLSQRHNRGVFAGNEELRVGRMMPWGATQTAAARFQVLRALARRGYVEPGYGQHALTHYARYLGHEELAFDRAASFGKIVKPVACASCGQRLPRRGR